MPYGPKVFPPGTPPEERWNAEIEVTDGFPVTSGTQYFVHFKDKDGDIVLTGYPDKTERVIKTDDPVYPAYRNTLVDRLSAIGIDVTNK